MDLNQALKSSQQNIEAEMISQAKQLAEPLDLNNPNFARLIERIGDKRVVCLGESTHGSEEFYQLRAEITKRLIQDKGFRLVAFEADYPDMEEVNEYINGVRGTWNGFHRFPTWMWRNSAFDEFANDIRDLNLNELHQAPVTFYGLDLYSLHSSLHAVIQFLQEKFPEKVVELKKAKNCLEPWRHDPTLYGLAVWNEQIESCQDEVMNVLSDVLKLANKKSSKTLPAMMNARALKSAEEYYRKMFSGAVASWNLRDQHMFDTIKYLLEVNAPDSKIIVWEHNSHIGNARATQMGALGEYNVGQLCREHFGDDAYLVGFLTHTGTVSAASSWDGEMEIKRLNPSRNDSYEHIFHETGIDSFLLPMSEAESFKTPRLERAVGVLYLPQSERQSHYFKAKLTEQFNELIWVDSTHALTPLDDEEFPDPEDEIPETYPFGV